MPLVQGICKSCGAPIEFDDSLQKGVCPFCHTQYVKDDVIINQHYHINDAKLTIDNDNIIEAKLKSAETFFKTLGKPESAKEDFTYVINNKPSDYRGWWGMVRVMSDSLANVNISVNEYELIKDYAESAIKTAPQKEKSEISTEWKKYSDEVTAVFAKNDSRYRAKMQRKAVIKAAAVALGAVAAVLVFLYMWNARLFTNVYANTSLIITIIAILFGHTLVQCLLTAIGRTHINSAFTALLTGISAYFTIRGMVGGDEVTTTGFISILIFAAIGLAITAALTFLTHLAYKIFVR